ncbi:peptidylprolyl isomerase [Aquisalimonas sp. 2447]|uniref:peptidylprolyl isomerase n=1 Tax=Aquisalimonas sp. 2447 TaxID=2740807 RepID=UPI0014324C2F|nr:peptidylprolyl isomerase [Aquisalimonas sp. 2447]QIT54609.1 peptidylprolyl isomerase [Aquisalimonas sp. 2447]
MRAPARITLGALLLAPALLLLTACGSDDVTTEENDGDIRIVAKVNGEPISETMLDLHVMRRTGQNPGSIDPDERETLLLELVEMALIAQDARDHGLHNDPMVNARMRNMHHAVLAQAMLENLKSEPIPEDEMLARFDDVMHSEEHTREYHARHILLESADDAEEVIRHLEEGADFAELAQEYSRGPTASLGGDLGWFVPGEMVEPFGRATMELDIGEHTREPVRTRYGYHVIRLEERRDREPPRFEDVAGHLERKLTQERIEGYVKDLRREGDVELYRPDSDD